MAIYHILIVVLFASAYFLYYDGVTNTLGILLVIIDVVFLLPLVFKTYYVLEDNSLFVHQWPFIRTRIEYSKIFEIDNKPVGKKAKIQRASLDKDKIIIGYYKYLNDGKDKEKRYVEISPADMDLFLIKMGGHFKRARDIAAKLEEEHKQKNAEHFKKKEIADKAREEKEAANKPVDTVVKPVKKNKAKIKVEETEK